MNPDQLCLIAIGANMASCAGRPEQTLEAALRQLSLGPARIEAISRFYSTPAFPAGSGPDFVNAAAALRMPGDAEAILSHLHAIEAGFGRDRTGPGRARWGQRTLDLDLIAIGDTVLPDPETFEHWRRLDPAAQRQRAPDRLILPHPRMQDRAFVLVPLAEIAPSWRHPVLRLDVRDMLAALPPRDVQLVRAL